VFDQTNDFPMIRSRRNVHVDRKTPTRAQVERDGLLVRAAFYARWAVTAARCSWFVATVRPRTDSSKYG